MVVDNKDLCLQSLHSPIDTLQALVEIMLDVVIDNDYREFHAGQSFLGVVSDTHLSKEGYTNTILISRMMAR